MCSENLPISSESFIEDALVAEEANISRGLLLQLTKFK